MEKFEQIITKHGGSIRSDNSKTTIEEIEKIISFRFPDDYKLFLQKFCGFEGSIGQEYLQLWDIDEIIESNLGYSIIENLSGDLRRD